MRLLHRSLPFVMVSSLLLAACGDSTAEPVLERVESSSEALTFNSNRRFGFIGEGARTFAHSFGTGNYVVIGNQNDPANPRTIQALEPASDPLPGERVVVRVGLFNARQDGYGQSLEQFKNSVEKFGVDRAKCYANPFCFFKPRYTWFQPDVVNVPGIEREQIVAAIRRWRALGIREQDITFEIGNEPNYFVSMTPGEYAFLYRQYYDTIKREAPDMKVALGAFFAFEFMPEDARDRVAELIALKGEHETAGKLAGLNAARSYFAALGSPASVILAGLHQWGTYAGSRATRDTKNLLFTRFFSRTTVQYFSEVMDALPEDVAPDVVSFHVYPADFATRLSFDDINDTIDELADNLNRVAYEKRRGVYPPPMCTGDYCSLAGPSIMITEMGNINPYINEQELAYRLYFTTEHLASYLGLVDSWFWYKPVGHDAQFQLLEGQTGIAPPHTRLVSDPAYVLPPFPGKVPCSALNYMGHLYYYLANDAFCEN